MSDDAITASAAAQRRRHVALQGADLIVHAIREHLPPRHIMEARDALAQIFYDNGIELSTPEQRELYERMRAITLDAAVVKL